MEHEKYHKSCNKHYIIYSGDIEKNATIDKKLKLSKPSKDTHFIRKILPL